MNDNSIPNIRVSSSPTSPLDPGTIITIHHDGHVVNTHTYFLHGCIAGVVVLTEVVRGAGSAALTTGGLFVWPALILCAGLSLSPWLWACCVFVLFNDVNTRPDIKPIMSTGSCEILVSDKALSHARIHTCAYKPTTIEIPRVVRQRQTPANVHLTATQYASALGRPGHQHNSIYHTIYSMVHICTRCVCSKVS